MDDYALQLLDLYAPLYDCLADAGMGEWAATLPAHLKDMFEEKRNSQLPLWSAMLEELPAIEPSRRDFKADTVTIGASEDISGEAHARLAEQLMAFHPWRKGPFNMFGVFIDTEWRSDWKWNRLEDHIQPLDGRVVLDIGCGNGYHCWRMHGAGARLVVGIDPVHLYVMQYAVMARYARQSPVYVIPARVEDMPDTLTGFDTVFSMGVLYHRKSPFDHLLQIKNLLRQGGELVLETLVVEGETGYALVPRGRYAKMRNVWFIPSPSTLVAWLERCGYRNVQLIDVQVTTPEEQRATPWMHFESLPDFLDKKDPAKTLEGYPAPRRAIVLATK